jgi:cellulose synthase (UDP-forming)
MWLATLAGVIALIIRWIAYPGDHTVLIVVGGWAVFNFILVTLAYRAVAEKQQRRAAPRVKMDIDATLWLADDSTNKVPIKILDASTGGIRILLETKTPIPADQLEGKSVYFHAYFEDAPQLEAPALARIISVQTSPEGQLLGLFLEPDQDMAVQGAVANLIFGDSENWRQYRQASQGIKSMFGGFAYAIYLFVTGTPVLLRDLAREPGRRAALNRLPPADEQPAHLLAFGVDLEAQARASQASRMAQFAAAAEESSVRAATQVDP